MVKCFPGSSVINNPPVNAGDLNLILSPKKEMATHTNILAWKIPWAEDPGGLQSMESQRVRHNLVTKQIYSEMSYCLKLTFQCGRILTVGESR